MRKLILNVAVSLDGFIEGPNGEYDWCFTDGDYGMEEFLARTDAIFFDLAGLAPSRARERCYHLQHAARPCSL